jgi:hypothetical protein
MDTFTVSPRHEPPDAEVTLLIRALPGVPGGIGDGESKLGDGMAVRPAEAVVFDELPEA